MSITYAAARGEPIVKAECPRFRLNQWITGLTLHPPDGALQNLTTGQRSARHPVLVMLQTRRRILRLARWWVT